MTKPESKRAIKARTSNMYPETKTWNPFVGCLYDCTYCEKSFKSQLKRVAWNISCPQCYKYEPHEHPERLNKIPSAPIVFVVGTGDIAFCPEPFVRRIFNAIDQHKPKKKKTYYFQSKNPAIFNNYMDWFNENTDKVILLTTLETNRNNGYRKISKAPLPIQRYKDFYDLEYPRKVVTIEPVMDFDLHEFLEWIFKLTEQQTLEYIWFGYDSKNSGLPEPSTQLAQEFVNKLQEELIEVRGKTLRDVKLAN
ncbi:MAG: hypothetical protein ACTSPB_01500 [Candidatus Thorarchaeota archaeon]